MVKQAYISTFAAFLYASALYAADIPEKSSPRVMPPVAIDTAPAHLNRRVTNVVVPPFVHAAWRAVRIAVTDKQKNRKMVYAVPIGGEFSVPRSDMRIVVESFLPAFVMDGAVMTSDSNELRNPAAKVIILEGGTAIYRGWLFLKFPSAQAMMHPVYGFSLVDVIPRRP